MAVTKLMNIKSSSHGKYRHLYNSINYILNPEKTDGGVLIGGNAGSEVQEIYQTFLNTKQDWDKTEGRQGYHFVISWKPGEIKEELAQTITNEFCETYLGDHYDFVYAIHNDQGHMHAHIVFNSVDRMTGYKYRYEKGDWEKYIQPVTDKICEKHGISRLEYDKDNRVGKSYAERYAEKEGKLTWSKIIRSDIDYMISCSDNWQDFLQQMKSIGYTFPRSGVKKGVGEYLTFSAPGGHRKRSDRLGQGYRVAEIKERIMKKEKIADYPQAFYSVPVKTYRSSKLKNKGNLSNYQIKFVKNYLRSSTYYQRKNPYSVNQFVVRKNLFQIEQLRRDCVYLLRNNIRNHSELDTRYRIISEAEKDYRKGMDSVKLLSEDEVYKEYVDLQKKIKKSRELPDDEFEKIQDRLEALEKDLPLGVSEKYQESMKKTDMIGQIRQEKRIIRHIKRTTDVDRMRMVKPSTEARKRISPKKPAGELNKANVLKKTVDHKRI